MESYYVLKDALLQYDIDEVIFEFSPSRLTISSVSKTSAYIISDYMKSNIVKTKLLTEAFEPEDYVNSFSPLRRGIDPLKLPKMREIKEIISKKRTDEYRYLTGNESYDSRGHYRQVGSLGIGNTAAVDTSDRRYLTFIGKSNIKQEEWDYFLKFLDLCKDKNIKLHVFVAPYPEFFFMRNKQYSSIMDGVKTEVLNRSFDYIDLNLAKEEYLDFDIHDFYDYDHLNYQAGDIMTDFIVRYLQNPSDIYFYDSLTEKYTDRNSVKYVGYKPYYITPNGNVSFKEKEPKKVESMLIEISALGYKKIDADVRLSMVEPLLDGDAIFEVDPDKKIKPGFSGVSEYYSAIKVCSPEGKEKLVTSYIIPYEDFDKLYKVELLEPGTDNVIFETFTYFNKE